MSSREEALFTEALAQPPAERRAFLTKACGADFVLLARVMALVAAHEGTDSLLAGAPLPIPADHVEKPGDLIGLSAVGSAKAEGSAKAGRYKLLQKIDEGAALSSEAKIGDRIGRYKLLQKIGEGGCGIVYMAGQDEPVRRRVALKVIKAGMDTREVIARFAAERQALAVMDHPGIAKVLDAGATAGGRPYFVMELVRGVPITRYSDEQNLTIRARIELFMRVCEAVQHAHQKGIIHRDLKPSNILVALHESVPTPTVIDFGIAKAIQGRLTDATLFTRYDQIIGTPAYMSPEQADTGGLDIDTRSDVYSLGVLLYELLTGRCPFDPGSLGSPNRDEIRRLLREVEPPRPSSRLSTLSGLDRAAVARRRGIDPARLPLLLAGDLDWIVMKAMEKNRTRRYNSPASVAEDLGRYLRNEPVAARPPGGFYRCRKFIRRNRLAVTAVAAIALTLVAATAISISQAVRATHAERVARAERNRATDERARSDDLLTFMLEELKEPLTRIGELAVLDRVIEKAMQQFTARNPAELDDRTLIQHVKVLYQLGLLRMDQARYPDAEAAFREAHVRAVVIVARNPRNTSAWSARADAEWGNGFARFQRGEIEEARTWFRREHDSRAALVVLEPDNPQWQYDLAKQPGNFAAIEMNHGDPERARVTFRDQLSSLKKLLPGKPRNVDLRVSIANTTAFLGLLAEAAGDFAEAAERYAQQTTQLEQIAQAEPKDPHWRFKQGESLSFHAGVCVITGQHEKAAQYLARARDLLVPLVKQDDRNQRWRKALLAVDLRQASLAQAKGEHSDAARLALGVRQELQSMADTEPTDVWTQYRLCNALRLEAELLHALGRPEAGNAARRAIEVGERLVLRDGATLAHRAERAAAGVIAARIAAAQGSPAAALAHCQRAAAVLGAVPENSRDWRAIDPAARLARLLGQSERAAALISQLDQTGYVPVEPWPERMTTIPARKI